MFTGLIEETGRIQNIKKGARSCVLTVECREVLVGSKVGDSICVNGVCLTVTTMGSTYFTADVMSETLSRSSLKLATVGSIVNLERAMPADGRFGGHFVSGHIDGTGTILSIREDDNAVWYSIGADSEILRFIVEKGSIAIDGISLTVASVDDQMFRVSVIPHTREVTSLSMRKIGDPVNLENDIIGKYVEKLIAPYAPGKEKSAVQSAITKEFLLKNGF